MPPWRLADLSSPPFAIMPFPQATESTGWWIASSPTGKRPWPLLVCTSGLRSGGLSCSCQYVSSSDKSASTDLQSQCTYLGVMCNGEYGVTVFYVLSGFLIPYILMSIYRRHSRNSAQTVRTILAPTHVKIGPDSAYLLIAQYPRSWAQRSSVLAT